MTTIDFSSFFTGVNLKVARENTGENREHGEQKGRKREIEKGEEKREVYSVTKINT